MQAAMVWLTQGIYGMNALNQITTNVGGVSG